MPRAQSKQPVSTARLLAALTGRKALGLCAFDSAGQVRASSGIEAGHGPAPGSHIEDFPFFAGLGEALRALPVGGGAIELPGLGAGDAHGARYDVRICWIAEEALFVALFHPAGTRIGFEFEAAQGARENRILLERVRRQQEQIEAQNELLRTFVANVPAAVAMLDGNFNYVLASQRWREDFASPAADLAQKPFRAGIAAKSRRFEQALRRKDGMLRQGVEKLEGAGGAIEWHRWEQQPWSHPGQTPGGTLVFAERITRTVEQTARLRAQARRLAALNDQMRSFALAASHDLRAPLRQIAAFASFLDADHASALGDQGREFVRLIGQCSERMTGMVEALLRYARLTYAETELTTFTLASAVKSAGANLQRDIAARGAKIEVRGSVQLRGDFALFCILLQNLIDNSLKYGRGAGAAIEIALDADDAGLTLSFSDNGPGIPRQVQAKAFDLFQRLGASAAVPGAGVGLAQCRKIAELHGGEMVIDGAYQDGLRLLLRLPAQMARGARRARKAA